MRIGYNGYNQATKFSKWIKKMTYKTPITVARGDGIGPEIMNATLKILDAAGAQLDINEIEIGEKVYKRGTPVGIEDSSWDSLRATKVFLKAPITTPQGGGFKSLNVTVRKSMGMFANIRPCVSYHPFVKTTQPDMDMIIFRENEEDLYAGIEHQQTENVVQCLKLISKTGSEKIIRYAFEYAKMTGRKKVTCISKDNIMKMADGLFHKTFDRIAAEYPDIENNHWIVDIGAARIASQPEIFDVIVTENLYGDIVSDIAAEVSGSVGLGGSANIGEHCAMFEAIHGSAPDITGMGIANPSGLIHGAILMLQHICQNDVAAKIHNAWLKTIEDGIHTGDIYNEETSTEKVGTVDFTKALIERLGQMPEKMTPVDYGDAPKEQCIAMPLVTLPQPKKKDLVGVDIFVSWRETSDVNDLAERLKPLTVAGMELQMIATRGLKVWPDGINATANTDHWCCRYVGVDEANVLPQQIISQMNRMTEAGLEFIKTENLYNFDGERGYTIAQGQ